jgi:hypothetical protein
LTETIFNGSADEKAMINYYNRTIEPILSSVTDGMKRRFLTKTGRSQGQSVVYFKNPFGLIPTSEFATAADTLSRNAILTPNELRAVMGYKPSGDGESDVLRNKNLNPSGAVPSPALLPSGLGAPNTTKGDTTNGSKTGELRF